jgi:hypothetical protein
MAEMIQVGGETVKSETHKLINSIWNMEKFCDEWKESTFLKLRKLRGL